MKSTNLAEHITASYETLRAGLGIIAIVLPLILWPGGLLVGEPLRCSMSAYYHAAPILRDIFVGVLVMVGAFLYLYKGYTNLENLALNIAGILVVLVALVPTEMPIATATGFKCEGSGGFISVHGTCAVGFFLAIAYVCIWRAKDTLSLIQKPEKRIFFSRVYNFCGAGMILSPAVALVLNWLLRPDADSDRYVFFAEAVGVWIFGLYWLLKSREIRETNAETRALDGELRGHRLRVTELFAKAPVQFADQAGKIE